MNYEKLYYSIINNRIDNTFSGYVENHHILPKSLGGNDLPNNLVKLSAREHFICHWLLTKMYSESSVEYKKMVLAFNMMINCKSDNQERYISSRIYEKMRLKFSLIQRENQSGENNSQFGTVWICNQITQESKRLLSGEVIPDGWEYGRIVNKKVNTLKDLVEENKNNLSILQSIDLNSSIPKRLKVKINTCINKILYKQELQRLHDLYVEVGFEEFVKITEYPYTLPNLVQTFTRNLDAFIPQSRIKRGK